LRRAAFRLGDGRLVVVRVMRLRDDSLLVFDNMLRRFTTIAPDGRLSDTGSAEVVAAGFG
jgi:hypothetical protein